MALDSLRVGQAIGATEEVPVLTFSEDVTVAFKDQVGVLRASRGGWHQAGGMKR